MNKKPDLLTLRSGFSIKAVVPNGEPIRGIAQMVKPNGELSTIIQAGDTTYSWDGTATGFTEIENKAVA